MLDSAGFLDSSDAEVCRNMDFEKNTLLFGSDPTPRIVAIELGETGTVKVYRREKDGSTTCDIEEFHPFVWLDSDVADLDIDAGETRGRFALRLAEKRQQLEGTDRAAQRPEESRPQFFRVERSGAALPHAHRPHAFQTTAV